MNFPDPNEHKHTHSLYALCLDCNMFGIDMPTRFVDASVCGNCGSINTVKYYPSCCMVEAFEQGKREYARMMVNR